MKINAKSQIIFHGKTGLGDSEFLTVYRSWRCPLQGLRHLPRLLARASRRKGKVEQDKADPAGCRAGQGEGASVANGTRRFCLEESKGSLACVPAPWRFDNGAGETTVALQVGGRRPKGPLSFNF